MEGLAMLQLTIFPDVPTDEDLEATAREAVARWPGLHARDEAYALTIAKGEFRRDTRTNMWIVDEEAQELYLLAFMAEVARMREAS